MDLPFPLILVMVPNHIGSRLSHASVVTQTYTVSPPVLPYSHQCPQGLKPYPNLIFGSLTQGGTLMPEPAASIWTFVVYGAQHSLAHCLRDSLPLVNPHLSVSTRGYTIPQEASKFRQSALCIPLTPMIGSKCLLQAEAMQYAVPPILVCERLLPLSAG